MVSLAPNSSIVDIGSSTILTCTPSLTDANQDANQYKGAKVSFLYQHSGNSTPVHFASKVISEGTLPTDSTPPLTIGISSAGIYTCTVTISEDDNSLHVIGTSDSGVGKAEITAQSKYLLISIL